MERVHCPALSAGLALIPLTLAGGEPGNGIQSPMVIVVLGGLLTAVVLNMLVVPALFLRYGVERPDTSGVAAPCREPEAVLEGVGEANARALTVQGVGERADRAGSNVANA